MSTNTKLFSLAMATTAHTHASTMAGLRSESTGRHSEGGSYEATRSVGLLSVATLYRRNYALTLIIRLERRALQLERLPGDGQVSAFSLL
jgi:hypothetical protein